VDGVSIFETPALLVYADAVGVGPSLEPAAPLARARAWSFVGVAQNYLYPTTVLQLYFHTVLAPLFGVPVDPAVRDGAVGPLGAYLDVLEATLDGGFLAGGSLSHADLLCGVMIDYAARTRAGRSLLLRRPKTSAWLAALRSRESFIATFPAMLEGTDEA
jgi:glutathione S-transferase